nr:deshydrogenase moke [Quercus suber]
MDEEWRTPQQQWSAGYCRKGEGVFPSNVMRPFRSAKNVHHVEYYERSHYPRGYSSRDYRFTDPQSWSRKRPERPGAEPTNQGDDIAGIIYEVGEGVSEYKPGDRVAALHDLQEPGGSYSEYAWAWAYTTFPLAPHVSYEGLPPPFMPLPDGKATPLVIYGGSSAVGSYAIQLAQRSNIHPVICIAGRASDHVERLIDRSKGDAIIDYRQGAEAVVAGIKAALKGATLNYALDAVAADGSGESICQVLEPKGKVTFVLNNSLDDEVLKHVQSSVTWVHEVHSVDRLHDFGFVFFRYIAKGLEEGWFKAQPHEVIPGGLSGIQKGLSLLKDGSVSAKKYVFKIADTPGYGRS